MDSYTENITSISEAKTRKQYIDPLLKKTGWLEKYIKVEVNSVKSNFKNKDFKFYNGQIERGVDKFIDYVLLDEDYTPLAVIEAKRFSKILILAGYRPAVILRTLNPKLVIKYLFF